jgi:hypothetical protein
LPAPRRNRNEKPDKLEGNAMMENKHLTPALSFLLLLGFSTAPLWASGEDTEKDAAQQVVEAAIEALGGEPYLNVKSSHSNGRHFVFRQGRKAWVRYWDWTQFDPVKWRFQQGEGRRQLVQIYNLEQGVGWALEGRSTIKDLPEEDVRRFRKIVNEDVNVLLRSRIHEEGMMLFYYGPDDIAGSGNWEAVEFLDPTNLSVVVFFDRKTRLPAKVETHSTDAMGIRRKQEIEFSNWHRIEGVMTPLRFDFYVDGEISSQRFLESISYNVAIPETHFQRPQPQK